MKERTDTENADVRTMRERGWLPERVVEAAGRIEGQVEEVRLRADGLASATVNSRNLRLGVSCGADELEETLSRLCGGSLYSYGDRIREGYLDLGDGWRAGVCGEGITSDGRMTGLKRITAIALRVPHFYPAASDDLLRRLFAGERLPSVLLYAPPGEGKTTLLRSLAFRLSRGERPYRVALIDSRGELYDREHMKNGLLDVYTGCPKADAIAMATRTMNPECLICDELGGSRETSALLDVQHCGVPLIASAHGAACRELLLRPNLRLLHDAGVFDWYVGLKRTGAGFSYTVTPREEAEHGA